MHDNVQTACLLNRIAFLKVLFDKIKPTEFEPLCSLLTPSNQRSTGQPSRVLHGHQWWSQGTIDGISNTIPITTQCSNQHIKRATEREQFRLRPDSNHEGISKTWRHCWGLDGEDVPKWASCMEGSFKCNTSQLSGKYLCLHVHGGHPRPFFCWKWVVLRCFGASKQIGCLSVSSKAQTKQVQGLAKVLRGDDSC